MNAKTEEGKAALGAYTSPLPKKKKKPSGDKARLKRCIARLRARIVDLESVAIIARAVVDNPTPAAIAMLRAAVRNEAYSLDDEVRCEGGEL